MSRLVFAQTENNARTTLAFALGSHATTVTVTSGTVFPLLTSPDYFWLTMWDPATTDPGDDSGMEIVKVTARASDLLTIARSQQGTSATDHPALETAGMEITEENVDELIEQKYHYDSTGSDISSDTTLSTESVATIDTSGGDVRITLPDVAVAIGRQNKYVIVKNDPANLVIIDGSGAQTVNGETTQVLTLEHDAAQVWNDGTEWFVI